MYTAQEKINIKRSQVLQVLLIVFVCYSFPYVDGKDQKKMLRLGSFTSFYALLLLLEWR